MSLWVISDNSYFCMGVTHVVKKTICTIPAEVFKMNVHLNKFIMVYQIDAILVSIKNYDLLKDILKIICEVREVQVFIETPSSVDTPRVNVCDVIVLHRKLTPYTLADISRLNVSQAHKIPRVDFSKLGNARIWSTLLHFQSGLAGNALAYKTSTSAKTLSSRKIKVAREMHIIGANNAVLFRFMNLFLHIYSLRQVVDDFYSSLHPDVKTPKNIKEGCDSKLSWRFHCDGGHVYYTG